MKHTMLKGSFHKVISAARTVSDFRFYVWSLKS